MRPRNVAAALAVIALTVVVGAVEFPRALDPTREFANGVTLNMLVDHGDGAEPNDWYSAQRRAPAQQAGSTIVLHAKATGRLIVSDIVPVFPHRCYAFDATLRVRHGPAALVAYDQEVTHFLDYRLVPATGAAKPVSLRFDSGGHRRISLVVAAWAHTRARLTAARLVPVDGSCLPDHGGRRLTPLLRPSR